MSYDAMADAEGYGHDAGSWATGTDRNPAAPDSGGARELVAEAIRDARGTCQHDDHIESLGACSFCLAARMLASPQFARLIAEAKAEALRPIEALCAEWEAAAQKPKPERAPTETAQDDGVRLGVWHSVKTAAEELRAALTAEAAQ